MTFSPPGRGGRSCQKRVSSTDLSSGGAGGLLQELEEGADAVHRRAFLLAARVPALEELVGDVERREHGELLRVLRAALGPDLLDGLLNVSDQTADVLRGRG